jgi:pimeloyl-ACP methyl ester carboxylesterase
VSWRAVVGLLVWIVVALPRPCPAHVERVGSLTLEACGERGAYCGSLDRALDPSGVLPDRIAIYFEFYPHSARAPATGTLVATEGGPGYPATGSRDDYLALFEPLRRDHDVVIMDNRGTGRSGAIDCRTLQTGAKWTVAAVAECGESLGERAPLYGTAYAADDLAAILDALSVRKIDLYGDSYGTYFEQVFATRHPSRLRSIVLDGAYPLTGIDYAWYPSYAPAMRDKFNLACARSPACAAIPGSSIDHIEPALERLRAQPFATRAHDGAGALRDIEADATQLAIVMYAGAPALTSVRETDAAARAFTAGDTAPLLRLMAETATAVDSRDPTDDPSQWSAGLAAAVMCHDPPQIFDMRLAPPARAADRDRALAERRRRFPDTYAPFTIDEYRAMPLDYSFLDQCVAWPVSPPAHEAAQIGIGAVYPDVPALVISGELDNITTPADGAAVAASFTRGIQVRIANSFHVNALPRARSICAAQIVRRFLATSEPGDTACAARVPAVRLAPRFVTRAGDVNAATASPGNQATPSQLRLVAAALATVGDIVARVPGNAADHGVGLRGGTFRSRLRGAATTITLDHVKWTEDLAVSGRVTRSAASGTMVRAEAARAIWVRADLRLVAADGTIGRVTARWRDDLAAAGAQISGRIAGRRVAALTPAP